MTLAAAPTAYRFTRDEYDRMAEAGVFKNHRVELINGEILQMSPQHDRHAATVALLIDWLTPALTGRFTVRCQMPLIVTNHNEPEPDIAVIAGPAASHVAHPHTAQLIIEVAQTSLAHDRRKAGLYAGACVNEYWIINLAVRQIEVYRQPQPDATTEFCYRYASMQTFDAGQTIQPADLPLQAVPVEHLLPAQR